MVGLVDPGFLAELGQFVLVLLTVQGFRGA